MNNQIELAIVQMNQDKRFKLYRKVYDSALQKTPDIERARVDDYKNKLASRLRGIGKPSAKELLVALSVAIEEKIIEIESRK